MSEESILLIDQMEANGESPEAIAEVLRKKEEEEKKFDPVNDLMSKIKGPTPTEVQVPLKPEPEPKTEDTYTYNTVKDENTGRLIKGWTKDVVAENTGETTSVLVNKKDVPQKDKDVIKKDITKRMSEDIGDVDIEEILDVFQPGDNTVDEFDKQINREAYDFNSTKELKSLNYKITRQKILYHKALLVLTERLYSKIVTLLITRK